MHSCDELIHNSNLSTLFLRHFKIVAMNYFLQTSPFVVPTTDGKLIKEHAGLASTGQSNISIAHMLAPAGWSEPHQNPKFDEWTLVSRGKKMFEIDDEQIIVSAGQSILVKKGARVRYSNPFDAECEYWSICLPAFSIENVNREES
jgi:mannose-6-phosphate isomerase-like protein (cupin superfamily)